MSARQFKKKIHIFPLLYVTQHHRGKKKKFTENLDQLHKHSKCPKVQGYIYLKKRRIILEETEAFEKEKEEITSVTSQTAFL